MHGRSKAPAHASWLQQQQQRARPQALPSDGPHTPPRVASSVPTHPTPQRPADPPDGSAQASSAPRPQRNRPTFIGAFGGGGGGGDGDVLSSDAEDSPRGFGRAPVDSICITAETNPMDILRHCHGAMPANGISAATAARRAAEAAAAARGGSRERRLRPKAAGEGGSARRAHRGDDDAENENETETEGGALHNCDGDRSALEAEVETLLAIAGDDAADAGGPATPPFAASPVSRRARPAGLPALPALALPAFSGGGFAHSAPGSRLSTSQSARGANATALAPSLVPPPPQPPSDAVASLRRCIAALIAAPAVYGSVPRLLLDTYQSVIAHSCELGDAQRPLVAQTMFERLAGEAGILADLRSARQAEARAVKANHALTSLCEQLALQLREATLELGRSERSLRAAEAAAVETQLRLSASQVQSQAVQGDLAKARAQAARLQHQMQAEAAADDTRVAQRTAELRAELARLYEVQRSHDDSARSLEREAQHTKREIDELERQHAQTIADLDEATSAKDAKDRALLAAAAAAQARERQIAVLEATARDLRLQMGTGLALGALLKRNPKWGPYRDWLLQRRDAAIRDALAPLPPAGKPVRARGEGIDVPPHLRFAGKVKPWPMRRADLLVLISFAYDEIVGPAAGAGAGAAGLFGAGFDALPGQPPADRNAATTAGGAGAIAAGAAASTRRSRSGSVFVGEGGFGALARGNAANGSGSGSASPVVAAATAVVVAAPALSALADDSVLSAAASQRQTFAEQFRWFLVRRCNESLPVAVDLAYGVAAALERCPSTDAEAALFSALLRGRCAPGLAAVIGRQMQGLFEALVADDARYTAEQRRRQAESAAQVENFGARAGAATAAAAGSAGLALLRSATHLATSVYASAERGGKTDSPGEPSSPHRASVAGGLSSLFQPSNDGGDPAAMSFSPGSGIGLVPPSFASGGSIVFTGAFNSPQRSGFVNGGGGATPAAGIVVNAADTANAGACPSDDALSRALPAVRVHRVLEAYLASSAATAVHCTELERLQLCLALDDAAPFIAYRRLFEAGEGGVRSLWAEAVMALLVRNAMHYVDQLVAMVTALAGGVTSSASFVVDSASGSPGLAHATSSSGFGPSFPKPLTASSTVAPAPSAAVPAPATPAAPSSPLLVPTSQWQEAWIALDAGRLQDVHALLRSCAAFCAAANPSNALLSSASMSLAATVSGASPQAAVRTGDGGDNGASPQPIGKPRRPRDAPQSAAKGSEADRAKPALPEALPLSSVVAWLRATPVLRAALPGRATPPGTPAFGASVASTDDAAVFPFPFSLDAAVAAITASATTEAPVAPLAPGVLPELVPRGAASSFAGQNINATFLRSLVRRPNVALPNSFLSQIQNKTDRKKSVG